MNERLDRWQVGSFVCFMSWNVLHGILAREVWQQPRPFAQDIALGGITVLMVTTTILILRMRLPPHRRWKALWGRTIVPGIVIGVILSILLALPLAFKMIVLLVFGLIIIGTVSRMSA